MTLDVVQVAGIQDQAEADLLVECGVKFLGFPFELAHHPEDLSKAAAAAIIRSLPPGVTGFLITYLSQAREIVGLCNRLGVSSVQLHGDVPVAELRDLKASWPELTIIKSLIVRGGNLAELEQSVAASQAYVDAYITDTFDPETGATGATGKIHDWSISQKIVAASPHPVILAGGLTATNVRAAILQVRPGGVDVHTGIEGPDGRKDRQLTRKFVREANAAFAELRSSLDGATSAEAGYNDSNA